MSILQVIKDYVRGYYLYKEYGPGGAGVDSLDRHAMEEAYRLRQPNDVLANALGVSEENVQYWYDHITPAHWRYGFKVLDLRIRISRHLANLALRLFAKAQAVSPYPFRLNITTKRENVSWSGKYAYLEKTEVVKMSAGENNVIS